METAAIQWRQWSVSATQIDAHTYRHINTYIPSQHIYSSVLVGPHSFLPLTSFHIHCSTTVLRKISSFIILSHRSKDHTAFVSVCRSLLTFSSLRIIKLQIFSIKIYAYFIYLCTFVYLCSEIINLLSMPSCSVVCCQLHEIIEIEILWSVVGN